MSRKNELVPKSKTSQGVRLVTRTGRRRRELAEICVERAGAVRGARLALRIVQWSIIAARLDHSQGFQFPSTRQFADEALVDERTAWRYRSTIREHFSEDEFRSLVRQLVESGVGDRTPRAASRLPVLLPEGA